MERLRSKIRTVPDFPKPGISFLDITPLVADPAMTRLAIHQLIEPVLGERIDKVVAVEARGFILGALAAWELNVGLIPLRKPGKLPGEVHSVAYDLEYGSASLEVHTDALKPGDRVLVIDDVLATGGTVAAACHLVEKLGAEVAACAFLIELDALQGRRRINDYRINALLHY